MTASATTPITVGPKGLKPDALLGIDIPAHDPLPPVFSVQVVGHPKPVASGLGFAAARSRAIHESYHPMVGARVVDVVDERGEVVETVGRPTAQEMARTTEELFRD